MKSLITSIVLLFLIYLWFDKVSIYVILVCILTQIFSYRDKISSLVVSLWFLITGYYIFLLDSSLLYQNILFLSVSILLGIFYSKLDKGAVELNILWKKDISIPNFLEEDNPKILGALILLMFILIWVNIDSLIDIFYNTSDLIVEKVFFTILLLIFTIYNNYFISEEFKALIEEIRENKSIEDFSNITAFFNPLFFIKTITAIVLILSIAFNNTEFIQNLGDIFYNTKMIFEAKDSNLFREFIRMVNEFFINFFF